MAGFFYTRLIENSVLIVFLFKNIHSFQKHIAETLKKHFCKLAIIEITEMIFNAPQRSWLQQTSLRLAFKKHKLDLTSR